MQCSANHVEKIHVSGTALTCGKNKTYKIKLPKPAAYSYFFYFTTPVSIISLKTTLLLQALACLKALYWQWQ